MKILFLVVLSFSAFSAPSEEQIKKYQTEIESEIKLQGKSERDKYYIYALFARELLVKKQYALSEQYYQKALIAGKAGKVEGMSEVYYNLLYIAHKLGHEKSQIKKKFEQVKNTLKEKDVPQLELVMKHWEGIINKDEPLDEDLQNSFYGFHYSQQKVRQYIQQKKYKKALMLLPPNLESANIIYQIQKDVLRRVVFPQTKDFLCQKKLKKYPNSITYTMRICRYLTDPSSVKLDEIKKQINKESEDKMYLLSALKDIK